MVKLMRAISIKTLLAYIMPAYFAIAFYAGFQLARRKEGEITAEDIENAHETQLRRMISNRTGLSLSIVSSTLFWACAAVGIVEIWK